MGRDFVLARRELSGAGRDELGGAVQQLTSTPISAISILPGEAHWQSRKVRYYAGDWATIQTILPEFDLVPFTAGPGEPSNPFLLTVMRKPLSAAERSMPVGVVSHSYALASHRDVASLCRKGLTDTGMILKNLRYEVGLSELGEWMNFRIYLDDSFSFTDTHGKELDLRLECFNSVDGSSRLVILFGWFRFVCSNGLVIGETKIEIRERHGQSLDLSSIPERIRPALEAAKADRVRMEDWQDDKVALGDIYPGLIRTYPTSGERRLRPVSFTFAPPGRTLSLRTRSHRAEQQKSQSDI